MATTFKFGNGNWAVKEDYALAYNDENGNFKPLPFDFTRASTATRVNKDGLLETVDRGMPRIDFTDNTSGHLLLEPSRTNLNIRSEDFAHSSYTKTNATITANTAISPDGSLNAAKITDDSTSGNHRIFKSLTTTAADHTFSIYLKKGTMTTAFLRFLSGSDIATANVDLEAGTITATAGTAKIEDAGSDWYRCSITGTAAAGTSYVYVYMKQLAGYVGTSQDLFLWGAQVEAGSYATSYIPTSGASVTRLAETCVDAGNSTVFNDSEGVLYVEVSALANDGTTREMALSDGGASNRIEVRYVSSANDIQAVIRGAASTIVLSYTLSDATEFAKVAVKYKSGDYALWIGGVERAVSTTTGTPTGLSQFAFDDGNGGFNIYSKVKDVKVYDTALSDSELQALTS